MVLSLAGVGEADAEYRLAPGDTLEVSIMGSPSLRQRALIHDDGRASIPLIGQTSVAGLTFAELEQRIREILPGKVFRNREADGQQRPVVISPDEVSVEIVEYRPVYVSGDVAKPGAQIYRPGMTLRQAVALAGGYDIVRFRERDPMLEATRLRGNYRVLQTELARDLAEISRLNAELENKASPDPSILKEARVPAYVASRLQALEAIQFVRRRNDHEIRHTYFGEAIGEVER